MLVARVTRAQKEAHAERDGTLFLLFSGRMLNPAENLQQRFGQIAT